MASKFTPGPWEAHGDGIRTAAEPGWLIATMGNTFHDNRPLIAEAPAMLAIIRQMLDQARGNAGKPMPDVLIGQALLLVGRIDGPTYAFVPDAEHERRVAELLEANNRYLERAREAESTLAVLATAGKANRG